MKIWIGKPDQSYLEGTAQCDVSQECRVEIEPDLTAYIRYEYRQYLVTLWGTIDGNDDHECCDIVGAGTLIGIWTANTWPIPGFYKKRPKNLVFYPCDDYGKIYIKFEDF